jgi:hypothetical protein
MPRVATHPAPTLVVKVTETEEGKEVVVEGVGVEGVVALEVEEEVEEVVVVAVEEEEEVKVKHCQRSSLDRKLHWH